MTDMAKHDNKIAFISAQLRSLTNDDFDQLVSDSKIEQKADKKLNRPQTSHIRYLKFLQFLKLAKNEIQ